MRKRRPRRQRPKDPHEITRDEFITRFCKATPVAREYLNGIVEPIAENVYDAIYTTIDGCVMPPTSAWMEDIIKKLEAR